MKLVDVGGAVLEGVAQIPFDVYLGGKRTLEDVGAFGPDVRRENAEERRRIAALISETIKDRKTLVRLSEIVIFDFLEALPESTQARIEQRMSETGVALTANMGVQVSLSAFIGRKLVERIVARAVAKRVAKFGVGIAISAVLIQGMIARASQGSDRLNTLNSDLFNKLQTENLDMVYFLVEDTLEPFVTTDPAQLSDPDSLAAFLTALEERLG